MLLQSTSLGLLPDQRPRCLPALRDPASWLGQAPRLCLHLAAPRLWLLSPGCLWTHSHPLWRVAGPFYSPKPLQIHRCGCERVGPTSPRDRLLSPILGQDRARTGVQAGWRTWTAARSPRGADRPRPGWVTVVAQRIQPWSHLEGLLTGRERRRGKAWAGPGARRPFLPPLAPQACWPGLLKKTPEPEGPRACLTVCS